MARTILGLIEDYVGLGTADLEARVIPVRPITERPPDWETFEDPLGDRGGGDPPLERVAAESDDHPHA